MPEYIDTKSILSKLKDAPDPYFGITYSMNLYRGCQHQCIYCDSRSHIYHLDDLSRIRVKQNALTLLEKAFRKRIHKGTIGTGSMNDPYMPLESDEKLTHKALSLIARNRYPVHVMTKSDLVTRDIEIIKEIKSVYAAVSFTITTTDDQLSKQIEPGAAFSSKRLDAMTEMNKAGIYTGVILSPVLQFITDTEENIKNIVKSAFDHGASYIIGWMGMTQREGQREHYYNKLDTLFPGVKQRYIRQFDMKYDCPSPDAEKLTYLFYELCDRYSIPTRMDFYKESKPEQLDLFPG